MSDEIREPSHRAQRLDLVFDADPTELASLRARVTDWLREHRWPEPRIDDVVLALNEAVTNSVEHAYAGTGGRIVVTAEVAVPFPGLGTATFAVRDRGRWRHRPPEESGHGLAVMRDVMDEVRIETGAAGTTVTLSTPVVALRT
ncbi:ATP-binding protein [Pseudonocardia lacus]|uniref:ATP-binding protein n=1 Tax=Pseudonocardia lacus TaxID=2835865 RepID=UPI001BDBC1AC|nr:ATP-binding protein [Pseudonocardia lacus]